MPKNGNRPNMVQRTITLPPALDKWLGNQANQTGIACNEIVRRALDEYRENHEQRKVRE